MGKLNLGLQRNKDGKIVRDDGEGGTKVVRSGGVDRVKYTPGRYVAKVLNVVLRPSTGGKNRGGCSYITETEVVEVLESAAIPADSKIRSKVATKVGDKPGIVRASNSYSYVDDVTNDGLACLGFTVDSCPPDEDPEALCDEVVIDLADAKQRNQKSPAAGRYVFISAWEGRYGDDSEKGEPGEPNGFVNVRISPLPEDLAEKYPQPE